jgi:ferredoxin
MSKHLEVIMGAYNTIAFDPSKCDGCGDCMTACATAKTGSDDIIAVAHPDRRRRR